MKTIKRFVTLFMVLSMVVVFAANAYAAEEPAAKEKAAKSSGASKDLININTAGVSELDKLPRVGAKMAQRIIEYREKNGKFKRIEDLMNVKGIGEKTFKQFEKMLTL